MGISKRPERLIEEWARTVDDYFKACIELGRLSGSGSLSEFDRIEFDRAEDEVRELKLVASRARQRFHACLRSRKAVGSNSFREIKLQLVDAAQNVNFPTQEISGVKLSRQSRR